MEYAINVKEYVKSVPIESALRSIKEIKVDRKLLAELTAAGLVGFGVYYLGYNFFLYFNFVLK